MAKTWSCPGTVVRVHDADLLICDVDLGYHVTIRAAVIVDELAAPAPATRDGLAARDHAERLLPPGTKVRITSTRLEPAFEKRLCVRATVAFRPPTTERRTEGSFATAMIAAGHGTTRARG